MRRWTRREALACAAVPLAGLTVTVFVAVTPAGAAPAAAAPAAGRAWTVERSPNVSVPSGEFGAVSCVAPDACTGVGIYINGHGLLGALAEAWNGTSWTRQPAASPAGTAGPDLLGVSCATADFCEAVGDYTVGMPASRQLPLAEVWNGTSWRLQPLSLPAGSVTMQLSGVSCTSPGFCEAVGQYVNNSGHHQGLAEAWNGTSWARQTIAVQAGSQSGLSAVSCVSAGFCEAAGQGYADEWNGTSWRLQPVPGSPALAGVSCVTADFCEAAGSGAAMWNGTSWRAQSTPVPARASSSGLSGVSCVSAAFCEAVGSYTSSSGRYFTLAEAWRGTSWAIQPVPSPGGSFFVALPAVSCATARACEAGGGYTPPSTDHPLAEGWNGRSWRIQPAPPHGATFNALNAVSCVTARFCEAVGYHADAREHDVGMAQVWRGTSWRTQATPRSAQAPYDLAGVSCLSAHFCEAVGADADPLPAAGAEMWNGTSWTVQAAPGPSLSAVSCVSADFCEAMGGQGSEADMWNGVSWSAQPTAAGFSSVYSVSCVAVTFCEAVGAGATGAAAEVWNGSTWSAQAVPEPAGGGSVALTGVSCTTADSCEAVGSYVLDSTGYAVSLAEVWNGTSWSVQRTPNPGRSLRSSLDQVSCTSARSCTAAGGFTHLTSTIGLAFAAVWNGTAWRLQHVRNPGSFGSDELNGIWCSPAGTCTAVGDLYDRGQTPRTLAEVRGAQASRRPSRRDS